GNGKSFSTRSAAERSPAAADDSPGRQAEVPLFDPAQRRDGARGVLRAICDRGGGARGRATCAATVQRGCPALKQTTHEWTSLSWAATSWLQPRTLTSWHHHLLVPLLSTRPHSGRRDAGRAKRCL